MKSMREKLRTLLAGMAENYARMAQAEIRMSQMPGAPEAQRADCAAEAQRLLDRADHWRRYADEIGA